MGGKFRDRRRGSKPPYDQRHYLEKVRNQWTKAHALFRRGEYSMAILRAAAMVELALNYVIEQELKERSNVSISVLVAVLRLCNGPRQKSQLCKSFDTARPALELARRKYQKSFYKLLEKRNGIAHSGQFAGTATAFARLSEAREMSMALIAVYDSEFELKELNRDEASSSARR